MCCLPRALLDPMAIHLTQLPYSGHLDLLIGNGKDSKPNELFKNNGDGTFTAINARSTKTTSVAFGDYDGDGRLDILIGNHDGVNELHHNDGGDTFTEMLRKEPTSAYGSTTSVAFGDVDNDGDADLFIGKQGTNGASNELYLFNSCAQGGNALGKSCYPCPGYSARIDTKMDICQECPKHQIGSSNGCVPCPAGSTRLVGEHECSPTPIGYYSNAESNGPMPCGVGRFGDQTGRTDDKCSGACAEGHYCAEGSTKPNPAACTVGFYLEETLSVNGPSFACLPCVTATMDCSIPGVTVANMPIKSGGWRYSDDTVNIIQCFNPNACAGNPGIAAAPANETDNATASDTSPARRRRLSTDGNETRTFGDELCRVGHTGFLCGQCKDNYHGYKDDAECEECGGSIIMSSLPLIALVVIILLALLLKWRMGMAVGINLETALEGGLQEAVVEKIDEKQAEVMEAVEARSNDKAAKPNKLVALLARMQKFQVKFKILVRPQPAVSSMTASQVFPRWWPHHPRFLAQSRCAGLAVADPHGIRRNLLDPLPAHIQYGDPGGRRGDSD